MRIRTKGPQRPSRSKRAMAAVAVAATSVAISVATVPSAQAASNTGWVSSNSGGAYIRAQPDAASMFYAYVGNGTPLSISCYRDGSWALGNYWTNRWFMTNVPTYQYGSPEAYIHASLVRNPQPVVPRC